MSGAIPSSPDLGGGGAAAGHDATSPTSRNPHHPPSGGPPPPRSGEDRRPNPLALAAYGLAAAVVALDQLSKWWVLGPLDLVSRGQLPVLPPVLNFTYVRNEGVSFHLLAGGALSRWGLTAFSLAVAAALAVWARRADKRLTAAGLGLIIGGAVGNAADRVRLGHVTDFIDVSGLHFPWVFNVADSAISVGVALLLLESLLAPKKPA